MTRMNARPAQVIAFPRRSGHDPELTYAQLAAEFNVSKRFLQARLAEGMPSAGLDYAGRRRFRLSEVRAFLDERQTCLGRRVGDAQSPPMREDP
jgi:hypothetical protein